VTQLATPSNGSLEITVDHSGNDAIVRPSGRINFDSSPDLRNSLQAILSTEPWPRAIIVDLASVPYIEASGIATLIEALRIARRHQTIFACRDSVVLYSGCSKSPECSPCSKAAIPDRKYLDDQCSRKRGRKHDRTSRLRRKSEYSVVGTIRAMGRALPSVGNR
jgi:anti-anti-sigma factor